MNPVEMSKANQTRLKAILKQYKLKWVGPHGIAEVTLYKGREIDTLLYWDAERIIKRIQEMWGEKTELIKYTVTLKTPGMDDRVEVIYAERMESISNGPFKFYIGDDKISTVDNGCGIFMKKN